MEYVPAAFSCDEHYHASLKYRLHPTDPCTEDCNGFESMILMRHVRLAAQNTGVDFFHGFKKQIKSRDLTQTTEKQFWNIKRVFAVVKYRGG